MKSSLHFPSTPQIVVVGSLLAFAAGIVLVVSTFASTVSAVGPETEARAGGLSAWVTDYQWLEHDHDGADSSDLTPPDAVSLPAPEDAVASFGGQDQNQGFAMPASMMPGTPDEGFLRLQVELDVLNRSSREQTVDISQFHLLGEDGRTWPTMGGGTFKATSLGKGHAYTTVAAFDVEESVSGQTMYLVWRANGEETHFLVSEGAHH